MAAHEQSGVTALREMILACESYHHTMAGLLRIGVPEANVLTHLAVAGPLTAREVADRIGLTPSAVTTVLDRLEAAGLALRRPHPTDRRRTLIAVTPSGQDALDTSTQWLSATLDAAGASHRASLVKTLTALAAGLREQLSLARHGSVNGSR